VPPEGRFRNVDFGPRILDDTCHIESKISDFPMSLGVLTSLSVSFQSAFCNPQSKMRYEAHLNSTSQGELVLSLSKEHPEDALKNHYGLQIAHCRFEIAQDRVGQSGRWKLRDHSCFAQITGLQSDTLQSEI